LEVESVGKLDHEYVSSPGISPDHRRFTRLLWVSCAINPPDYSCYGSEHCLYVTHP
jgi:hypothetical protein